MERIVVGIDGSEGSRAALRWAANEAHIREAVLEAVLVWSYLDQRQPGGSDEFHPDYTEDTAAAALDTTLDDELGSDHGLRIERTVVNDLPARALLAVADGADLLVVGSRGLGGFRGLMLGSVSQQCVQHAPCPTVVVPASREE